MMATINDVHRVYAKTLHIENFHLVDIPLATYITKDMDGDRLFLIGKGASGSGKTVFTEPLRRLSFNPLVSGSTQENRKYRIFFISRITPAVFARGTIKDGTKDLGYHLQNHASFLIYSDLAPLLTMNEDTRRELFGMFRDLFDGFIKYDTANVPKYYYNIKVNSMGFATHMIEQQEDISNLMGTREIVYELPELKQIEKAMIKRDTEEGREERTNIIKDFLDDIGKVENEAWKVDKEFKEPDNKTLEFIRRCSMEAAIDRTPALVNDQGLLVRHIKTEFPMRLNNQLIKFYQGLRALGLESLPSKIYVWQIADTCGISIRTEILEHL